MQLSDRIAVMFDGRITALIDARQVTKEQVGLMRYVIENYRPELVGLPVNVESHELTGFELYPNPVSEILTVKIDETYSGHLHILDSLCQHRGVE